MTTAAAGKDDLLGAHLNAIPDEFLNPKRDAVQRWEGTAEKMHVANSPRR